jgi:putative membrane protein (TIGR04086 family)
MAHTPNDQLGAAISAVTHASPWLCATQLLVGLLCSLLGGYVAAWLAKHDELLNGTLSSLPCLAVGFYSMALGKDSHAHWVQFLMLVAAPICGFFGGYLRVQQRRVHCGMTIRSSVTAMDMFRQGMFRQLLKLFDNVPWKTQ